MRKVTKGEKIKELEKKLKMYEEKLAKKKLGWGQVGRTGSGDSFSDQLRDDTNSLAGLIVLIKEEIETLKNEK